MILQISDLTRTTQLNSDPTSDKGGSTPFGFFDHGLTDVSVLGVQRWDDGRRAGCRTIRASGTRAEHDQDPFAGLIIVIPELVGDALGNEEQLALPNRFWNATDTSLAPPSRDHEHRVRGVYLVSRRLVHILPLGGMHSDRTRPAFGVEKRHVGRGRTPPCCAPNRLISSVPHLQR